MDGTVEKEYTHKINGIKLQASRIKHLCSLTLKWWHGLFFMYWTQGQKKLHSHKFM